MKMFAYLGPGLNNPNPNEVNFEPFIIDYIKVYKPNGYQPYDGIMDFDYWHDNIVIPLYIPLSIRIPKIG